MDRYIGLDVHAQSCTFVVLGPSGRMIRSAIIETNGMALLEFLKLVPGTRHLCIEECAQSQWLYELLAPHTAETRVVVPDRSMGNKNDALDARGLADAIRLNRRLKQVYKGEGPFSELRELARTYRMVHRDVVRTKNRLKSCYRARGVSCPGQDVYRPNERELWLRRLPPSMRLAARTLYEELDSLDGLRDRARKQLIEESHRHAITGILETAPGLGPIRIAQLLPIVVTPHRFRTKRTFWAYCGFAVIMRSSSDWQQAHGGWQRAMSAQTRGLNRKHNKVLKEIFKGAATTVLAKSRSSPLCEHYNRLLEQGTKPNLAKLTLARNIAAITLAMWKNQEAYDPTKQRRKNA